MKVVISGFVSKACCEMTNKKECECVRVALQDDAPEALIAIPELVKQLRFLSRQESKNGKPAASESASTVR